MKCIDFDKKFQFFVADWAKRHAAEYRNYDELEAHVGDAYAEFLAEPADWLAGERPGEYFEKFEDPKQLVNWMEDYEKQRIPVPDMLLNRISDLKGASEAPLINLLAKERASQSAKMSAVTLLREIESEAPAELYIEWIKNAEKQDELCENALESLNALGEAVADRLLDALNSATDEGKISFLTVLCALRKDAALVDTALSLLQRTDAVAVLSDVLAQLGDERALPVLRRIAGSEETPYLDYIELRNAIEALGGEAPEREFDAEDPDYLAMRALEEKQIGHSFNTHEDDDCECGGHGRLN